ncbi:MAG: TolC family protein [Ghiorsea sp.]
MLYKQFLLVLSLGFLALPQAYAKGVTLSFDDVLSTVFNNNTQLKTSALQVKMKDAEGNQLDGTLDTRYGGSVGANNEVAPTTSPFAATETNASFLSGQVVKPFTDGSTLTGSLKYTAAKLIYPSSVNPAFQSSPNPLYQHQIDLIYRYPLVQGKDNPSYQYQKDAVEQESQAAMYQTAMLKEQLANQTIGLYAQFVLNDLSLTLAKDATFRARQLLAYQKKQESFGLLEADDRLPTQALIAARKLQEAQAMAAKDAAQTALNRLMNKDGDIPLQLKLNPLQVQLTSVQNMLEQATKNRPVFRMLDAQYGAAESRLSMAQASGDYQLDVVGQIGSRALDGSAGIAFAQGFTLDDRYIGVSLEFSDVLDNKSNRYAIERNVLALEGIQLERRKTHEDLETEIANLNVTLRSAEVTLKAAKRQVLAERKKYKAQMIRYKEGRTTTAVMIQYEGDLRSAELRDLMQEVSLSVTEYQLALALGELPALASMKEGAAQ